MKIFSSPNALSTIRFAGGAEKNIEKKFGSLKKGRIFAPAFDRERHPKERPPGERENVEILRSRDSVCHGCLRHGRGRMAQTSQRLKSKQFLQ